MNMRDALLQEFDLERPLTRRCLERVPEGSPPPRAAGIYLRINDIAVPAIYNDSADEQGGVFRT